MRALIVDAGNTRTKCAAWEQDSALARLDPLRPGEWLPAAPLRLLAELATPHEPGGDTAFLTSFAELHAAAGRPPVVLVSTVPRVGRRLATLTSVIEVDHRSALPCDHILEEPAQTGPDRLCNIAAAAAAGLRSAYIVDAGTATTVDVLVDGVFRGGVIAPGMAFAAVKLGEVAARLEAVPFAPTPLVAGANTAAAMAAGGFHAGVGGVEHLLAGLQEAHGPAPVIVTGGLGAFLAKPGRVLDLHWTLRGAAVLAGLIDSV